MNNEPEQTQVLSRTFLTLEDLDADDRRLAVNAAEVLKANDVGEYTRPAPTLYPHQWSWDSAVIAIGLAHLDYERACRELDRLFKAQWRTGKIPHIVFDSRSPEQSYFPGSHRWDCGRLSSDAPTALTTSGICQPPLHSLAALRIFDVAQLLGGRNGRTARDWLKRIYPRLFAWHRYLVTLRDPERSGLVTIYHPWESGCDNSPRWDFVMGRLVVGHMPPYTRYDTRHVEDPIERPTDTEYDYYVWLVEELKKAAYNEPIIHKSHPFLVKDVLFSAILVAANQALLEIAEAVTAPRRDLQTIQGWISRGQSGIHQRVIEGNGVAYDYDVRLDMELRSSTFACLLAPFACGKELTKHEIDALVRRLYGDEMAGHPEFMRPLPPSTSPSDPGFRPRTYWRGPVWPIVNWLFSYALRLADRVREGVVLRAEGLDQIRTQGLWEYFEPFTGEGMGSDDQSWTAAVTLDWLLTRNPGDEFRRRSLGLVNDFEVGVSAGLDDGLGAKPAEATSRPRGH
jgi:hypothetical protein